ncbi:MAG: abortive infection family protein [Rhodobacteraceae bacterium]|nr:abortive infection family protein [Paracoccaceae bacterium]MCY4250293.1 abortive infection family protein [Paracoccaceae bacterium]
MNQFVLQASRQVSEMAPGAIHIRMQIQAIETAIEQSPAFVFDLSKSLIDTVCKTILEDRGVKLPSNPNSSTLLKETLKALKLHHEDIDQTEKTFESLKKTANGLHTAFTGIYELRNRHGLIGHGRDGYAPALDNIQAQFVASAADTIVHLLYRSHKGYGGIETVSRIVYEDYGKENMLIDESYDDNSITEFVKKFRPSDVLYKMDRDSYRAAVEDVRNLEAE